ncbi:MAG: TFIIB-type zinc ribbon-containing protein [Nitrospirota bacterium]
MKCPSCTNVELSMSERQGIEIDYCPTCRGVWLDRGELDKVIERSTSMSESSAQSHREQHYVKYDDHKHKQYKRKSLLHELFD